MQRQDKNKIKISQKIILFSLIFFALAFFPLHKSSAALWPAIDPMLRTASDMVMKTIQGIMIGLAKQAAFSSINTSVTDSVNGSVSLGGEKYITNWTDYLVSEPQSATETFMNDYISEITGGTGSSSYEDSDGFSLSATFATGASDWLSDSSTPTVTYEGDPSKMFEDGNFKNFNSYMSGINNPWAFNNHVESVYAAKLAQEKQTAMTTSIAYKGFKATLDSDGNVVTPGSTTEQMVANVQDMGNKIVASAQNLPEVISSIASKMVVQTIMNGIGSAD